MEFLVVQGTRIDYGRSYLETIYEEEELSTSPEKQVVKSTKVCTLPPQRIKFGYLSRCQKYVLSLLQSLRRKLFLRRIQALSLTLFDLPTRYPHR